MWLWLVREAPADVPYWPGRRWLACVDAVGWPCVWILMVHQAPEPVGLFGPFVGATALLCALGRLHRAFFANHHYRFTTWRWGRIAVALMLIGALLKLMLMTPG